MSVLCLPANLGYRHERKTPSFLSHSKHLVQAEKSGGPRLHLICCILSWCLDISGPKGVLASKGSCNKPSQTQRPTQHQLLTCCFCSVWSIRQTFSTLESLPTRLLLYNSVIQHGSKWAKIKMSAGLYDLTNCFTSSRLWVFLGSQPHPLPWSWELC